MEWLDCPEPDWFLVTNCQITSLSLQKNLSLLFLRIASFLPTALICNDLIYINLFLINNFLHFDKKICAFIHISDTVYCAHNLQSKKIKQNQNQIINKKSSNNYLTMTMVPNLSAVFFFPKYHKTHKRFLFATANTN